MSSAKRKAASAKGGNMTLMRYGVEHFKSLGQRGGRPRSKYIDELRGIAPGSNIFMQEAVFTNC